MGINEYVVALRRRWAWIAVTVLVAMALALTHALLATPVYEARSQVFISTNGTTDASELYQASDFTQQRVKSYAEALSSPLVLDPVIDQLGLDVSATELAESVEVIVPLDTVLLDVRVKDENPAVARNMLDAINDQFASIVDDLENTSGSGTSPVAVTVLSEATLQEDPVSPQPLRNLAIAVMMGLVLGVAIALLRELLDKSVADEADVHAVTDTTVLGRIPFAPEAGTGPAAMTDPTDRRAEAYRALRTNLGSVGLDQRPRSLLVTCSVPGEGTTTTAANLASVMAENGTRVCLVEADLRRPRLMGYLGFDDAAGLTEVLLGEVGLEDVLQPVDDGRLQLLGAGRTPPNPAQLLSAPAMTSLLRELESRFDVVVLDAPPVQPVTDAVVLSHVVDGVLLVVGAGIARSDTLLSTLETLDLVNAEVVGLVLNRLRHMSSDSHRYVASGRTAPARQHVRESPVRPEKRRPSQGEPGPSGSSEVAPRDHEAARPTLKGPAVGRVGD